MWKRDENGEKNENENAEELVTVRAFGGSF